MRIANMNDLFEKNSPSSDTETIIDCFYLNREKINKFDSENAPDLSPNASIEADDDAMIRVLEKEAYYKMET